MSSFVLQRFFSFFATLAVTSVVVFAVLEWLPGNAAQVILGETATPESLAALEQKLGLNQPAFSRYVEWVGGLLQGQSGISISYDTPTAALMMERLHVTLPLAIMAMGITMVMALCLGLYAASKQNTSGDVGVMTLSQLGLALPNFWLAILLILLFAVHLQWVSAGGFPGWSEEDGGGLLAGMAALILPAMALAAVQTAILTRVTRSAVIESMSEDYVRTARAKGLSERAVLFKHVLRNALIPILTGVVVILPTLFIGNLIIEAFFGIPGLGSYTIEAIQSQDFAIVRAMVFLGSLLYIVGLILTDISYTLADPRVRLE